MSSLERNRVFENAALEELRQGGLAALNQAEAISSDFDYEVKSTSLLLDQVPAGYKDFNLSTTLSLSPTSFVYDDYVMMRSNLASAMDRLTFRVPAKDTEASALQKGATAQSGRCIQMLQELSQFLNIPALNQPLPPFLRNLDAFTSEWEEKELEEQIPVDLALDMLGFAEYSILTGDPVNLITGNFLFREYPLSIAGPYPLGFTYTYNSLSAKRGTLGRSFVHNLEQRLEIKEDMACYYNEEGRRQLLLPSKDGYQGRGLTLKKQEKGWELTTKENICSLFYTDGRLHRQEDYYKNGITLFYDTQNRLEKAETDTGETLQYTYENGRLGTVRDHTGRTVKLHYEDGHLIQATDPEGNGQRYEYADNNRIQRIVDKNGVLQVENEYDEKSRVISQRYGEGLECSYRYKENQTEFTGPDGIVYQFDYDKRGRLLPSKDLSGEEKENPFCYQIPPDRPFPFKNIKIKKDKKGNILCLQSQRGTDRFAYDKNNNLLKTMYPDDTAKSYQYNKNGNLSRLYYEDGSYRSYTYDVMGHLHQVAEETGETITIDYDIYGRLKKFTRVDGSYLLYYYDDERNYHDKFASGSQGNLWIIDSRKDHNRYPCLRKKKTVEKEVSRTCDASGNIISRTLKEGTVYRYTYDALNRLTSVTDQEENCFTYTYDKRGRCIKKTDPLGAATCYAYSSAGELILVTDALGHEVDIKEWSGVWGDLSDPFTEHEAQTVTLPGIKEQRDSAGRLLGRSYPGGVTSAYAYDILGWIEAIHHKDGEGTLEKLTYGYDANGNCIHIQRVSRGKLPVPLRCTGKTDRKHKR